MQTLKIITKGGLILVADAAKVEIADNGSITAVWDMRHQLIRNEKFYMTVRGNDVKEIYHVA